MAIARYIDPFTDFGFKKLFGEEINKDLLIDFLNELLKGKEKIKDLWYKNTEQLGASFFSRDAVYDIYCENKKGEKFIVEMQKAKQNFFRDRSVFYSTFPIQEQASKGKWNFELKAVYLVGILDFVFNEDADDKDKYLYEVKLMETETTKVFYDKLTFYYIEMPKFNKTESELNTKFEKWIYLLKQMPELENRPKALQERIFERVMKAAEIAKYNPTERMEYHRSLKAYRDLYNTVETATSDGIKAGMKKGMDTGIKEGLKEGIEIGMEKGIKEGIEKGREEGELKKALAIATEMLNENMPVETISRMTGLEKKVIERLQKSAK